MLVDTVRVHCMPSLFFYFIPTIQKPNAVFRLLPCVDFPRQAQALDIKKSVIMANLNGI